METYDFYIIGGRTGFYVGLAKHLPSGGWRRRVGVHRRGTRAMRYVAHRLLTEGRRARCLGTIHSTRAYANRVERNLWKVLVARDYKAEHPCPSGGDCYGMPSKESRRRGGLNSWKNRTPESEKGRGELISAGILASPSARAARRANGRKTGKLPPKDLRKCGEAGRKGTHRRWHLDRGLFNPDCKYCRKEGDDNV